MIRYVAKSLFDMVEHKNGAFVLYDEVEKLQEQYENELRDKESEIVRYCGIIDDMALSLKFDQEG